jgi:hypothetical protein
MKKVPEDILAWIKQARSLGGEDGDLSGVLPSNPLIITKDNAARALFDQFSAEQDRLIFEWEKTRGLGEIWGRAWEHADKIALVCACATDLTAPIITAPIALWAIKFITHHTKRFATNLDLCVFESENEKNCQEFLAAITKAGPRGLTEYEMQRKGKPFTKHKLKDRKELIDQLVIGGKISEKTISPEGKGKPRRAWVAAKFR